MYTFSSEVALSNNICAAWAYLKQKTYHEREVVIGSGALSRKMLLVRIVENYTIDDYLGPVRLSKFQICPSGLEKGIG